MRDAADTGKPEVSREAEDFPPTGQGREQDGAREAKDADVAGDAAWASARDDGDAGDLGAEAADDARDAGEPAGAEDLRPGAGAAADDAPGAGDADESADAGQAAPDRKPPPADDRDQKAEEKPDKPSTDEEDDSGATPVDGEVTIVPGVSRYHRRGCILIRFLSDGNLETMTRGEAEAAGSIACKACQPDKPVSDY